MRHLTILLALLFASPGAVLASDREVFHPKKARFGTFPREVALNTIQLYEVRLKSGFFSPVMAVSHPDGATEYVRPLRELGNRKYEFQVPFEAGRGKYRVELVVDSSEGDTTAAQFTMWVGVKKPAKSRPTAGPIPQEDYPAEPPGESTFRLERKLFDLMNEYRDDLHLTTYPWMEEAAYLAREHLTDYLALKPRPKTLIHIIPGKGSIADRFNEVLAWPRTIRKFPQRNPAVGPEAVGYCSEALASVTSLTWLFKEYFLEESAFRLPVISKYPTHAAVGIVRHPRTGKLYTATVYVQLNSTRVAEDREEQWAETMKLEENARDPVKKAAFLRRLGRVSDPRSEAVYRRRLDADEEEVRAAALDALFLTDPELADKWVARQKPRLARAHREDKFKGAIPILKTFAAVEYDLATRTRGERELKKLSDLASRVLTNALKLLEIGDEEFAKETLELISRRFEGLPEAVQALKKLKEMEDR
jgi:hypothetical protein